MAESQTLQLYAGTYSQPSRAVMCYLKFNNIPYELKPINIYVGEHHTPDYEKINELKLIPAIVEGDFHLSESHSIMRYLQETRDCADHWYPKDDKKRKAEIDRYLDWHWSNTRRFTWLEAVTLAPDAPQVKKNNVSLEGEKKITAETLNTIEKVWLKDTKFIKGDEISIADLSCFTETYQLHKIKYDFTPYPVIQQWMDRCMEFPVIKELHEPLFPEKHEPVITEKQEPVVTEQRCTIF